jgi:hypothetical protein
VGPRAGLDMRKNLASPGFDPRTVQPVAQSLYRLSYRAHIKNEKYMSVASLKIKLNSFTADRMSLARQPIDCQQLGFFRIHTVLTPCIMTLLCDKVYHQRRHLGTYHSSLTNKTLRSFLPGFLFTVL